MTYLLEALDKPARLYIKQCPHCDLKYFGKTVQEDVEKYEGSGTVWQRHLKKHKVKPIHLWNSDWYHDTSISNFATKFSALNKIVESKEWANITVENGIQGGYLGEEVADKKKKTMSDPKWKETKGKQSTKKRLETISDPIWKATVGVEKNNKLKETISDPVWKATVGVEKNNKTKETRRSLEWKNTVGKTRASKCSSIMKMIQNDPKWKATVGKEKAKKISQIMNDPGWQETVGKERSKKAGKKISQTMNDPEWKATVGAEAYKKQSQTRNDPEWKARNSKTCEHCGKTINKSNHTRWHGDKCKWRQ